MGEYGVFSLGGVIYRVNNFIYVLYVYYVCVYVYNIDTSVD